MKTLPGNYAMVNGLQMYYEIHGTGSPFVLIHGGGSTIDSNFAEILPEFAKHHKTIAVELQAHGHTSDRDRPLSFEQDADDVAELLRQTGTEKADFLGFSNGGTTCLQICIRHPHLVKRLVLASANFKRSGLPSQFWESMQHATIDQMPMQLKDAYLKANPDPAGLQAMFNRDRDRMLSFRDIEESAIRNIQVPVFIMNGDQDVVTPEHAIEISRMLNHSRLAILPAAHGEYLGEICSVNRNRKIIHLVAEMIEEFLSDPGEGETAVL